MGKVEFAIIDGDDFFYIVGSYGELFGVVDDNIVIGDNFRGTVKDIDYGEGLTVF